MGERETQGLAARCARLLHRITPQPVIDSLPGIAYWRDQAQQRSLRAGGTQTRGILAYEGQKHALGKGDAAQVLAWLDTLKEEGTHVVTQGTTIAVIGFSELVSGTSADARSVRQAWRNGIFVYEMHPELGEATMHAKRLLGEAGQQTIPLFLIDAAEHRPHWTIFGPRIDGTELLFLDSFVGQYPQFHAPALEYLIDNAAASGVALRPLVRAPYDARERLERLFAVHNCLSGSFADDVMAIYQAAHDEGQSHAVTDSRLHHGIVDALVPLSHDDLAVRIHDPAFRERAVTAVASGDERAYRLLAYTLSELIERWENASDERSAFRSALSRYDLVYRNAGTKRDGSAYAIEGVVPGHNVGDVLWGHQRAVPDGLRTQLYRRAAAHYGLPKETVVAQAVIRGIRMADAFPDHRHITAQVAGDWHGLGADLQGDSLRDLLRACAGPAGRLLTRCAARSGSPSPGRS